MMSRHLVFTTAVATFVPCRDLLLLMMMSRLYLDVATYMFSALGLLLSQPLNSIHDIMSSSSSIPGCLTLSFFRTHLVLFAIKLHLRLELCCRNLNMHFDCCKGFKISKPLIFLRLSCCSLLHQVISVLLSHLLPLLLQKILIFLEFPAA